MHVHSHLQGVSPARSQEAANASARSAMSSATPFSVVADGDGTSASDTGAAFSSNAASPTGTQISTSGTGTAAPDAFSSLSSNIQALLLGVGQNGQSASMTGALQAYSQTSLFA